MAVAPRLARIAVSERSIIAFRPLIKRSLGVSAVCLSDEFSHAIICICNGKWEMLGMSIDRSGSLCPGFLRQIFKMLSVYFIGVCSSAATPHGLNGSILERGHVQIAVSGD